MPPIIRTLHLYAPLASTDDETVTVFQLEGNAAFTMDTGVEEYQGFLSKTTESLVPVGTYLFCQALGPGDLQAIAAEALDLHKEGLWRGHTLGDRLYVRVLEEENGVIHQLMRPVLNEI